MNPPPDIWHWIGLLEHGDDEEYQAAAAALKEIGEPAVGPLIHVLESGLAEVEESFWLKISDVLTHIGSPAVVPLIEVARNPDYGEDLRANAVEILGDIRDQGAVEPLIGILNDTEDEGYVRYYAAFAR